MNNLNSIKNIKIIKKTPLSFKIGAKVKFKEITPYEIPTYFTEDSDIPEEKIIHGTINLGNAYYTNFAQIVDQHNDFWIVSWISEVGKEMRLGFLEESLELIN